MSHLSTDQAAPAAPAPAAAAENTAGQYKAVEGSENFSGSTLLVEAYSAIWIVLMAWILLLWRKQGTMAERLDDLERTIDRAAAAAEKKAAKAKAS